MIDVNLKLDQNEIDKISENFIATDKQLKNALNRALNKTIQWFRSAGKKAIAARLGISARALDDRFYSKSSKVNELEAQLWIGLLQMPVGRLGQPIQTATGVKVGKRFFTSAFMALYKKGKSKRQRSKVFRRSSHSSLPIEGIAISIEQQAKQALSIVSAQLRARFIAIFKSELNFQVNVRGAA